VEPSHRKSAAILIVGQHSPSLGPLANQFTCATPSVIDTSVDSFDPACRRTERRRETMLVPRPDDVPSSVELRWRPGEHQAALTSSLCTVARTVSPYSCSSAVRSAGRCRWPLTRRNCLPACTSTGGNCIATGCDKLVVADIIDLLIEALRGIGIADKKRLQAHTKADHHTPSGPDGT
jgi:hypothetical protein